MASILSIIVLAIIVFFLTFRDYLKISLSPWQMMLAGAIAVIFFGEITPKQAFGAIDLQVMVFLYGMFVLAQILQDSLYLEHLGYKVLRRFSRPFDILCAIVFSIGISSAFLLNDTIAIIGLPLCIHISKKSKIGSEPLLIVLALAVTIGGIASPIGNPQNYIIASQPVIGNAFSVFFLFLGVPTLMSLFFLVILIWYFYPETKRLQPFFIDVKNKSKEYYAARRGFQVIIILTLLSILSDFFPIIPSFDLFFIAIIGTAVSIILSGNFRYLTKADFETLIFFASMFVLMESVWLSGFFQQFVPSEEFLGKPEIVIVASLILSQFLSNVPFVILYLKALGSAATPMVLSLLAVGSTLAGAITILGAASNIIILQSAEKKKEHFPTLKFMLFGVVLTLISLIFLFVWLKLAVFFQLI